MTNEFFCVWLSASSIHAAAWMKSWQPKQWVPAWKTDTIQAATEKGMKPRENSIHIHHKYAHSLLSKSCTRNTGTSKTHYFGKKKRRQWSTERQNNINLHHRRQFKSYLCLSLWEQHKLCASWLSARGLLRLWSTGFWHNAAGYRSFEETSTAIIRQIIINCSRQEGQETLVK